jgi:hypothetical protein
MKKNSKRKSLRRKSPLMKKNSKRKSLRKKSSMKRKNEDLQQIIRQDSFSIEKEHLFYFFNLLKEKEEHCGYLVIENYNRNRFFNLKPALEHNKSEEIKNIGDSVTCQDIILVDENRNIYPQCRWHTHPICANPYPSPQDMFHLIAIKELYTSIIFTTLGIWEIYYDGENIWDGFTQEKKDQYYIDTMDKMLVINNNFYYYVKYYFYFLPKYNDTIIKNIESKDYLMYYVTEYIKDMSQFNIQLNFSLWGDINNDYQFKSPHISKNSLIEFNKILKNPNIKRFKHK